MPPTGSTHTNGNSSSSKWTVETLKELMDVKFAAVAQEIASRDKALLLQAKVTTGNVVIIIAIVSAVATILGALFVHH